MKQILIILATISVAAAVDYTNVKFTFIGTDINDTLTARLGQLSGLATKYFDPSRKTVIYFNSYRQNFGSDDVGMMVNAYLTRRAEYNIIYGDWTKYTNNLVFVPTLQALDGVSDQFGKMLYELFGCSWPTCGSIFSPSSHNLHLVGFGVGAHLAGYIGRVFRPIQRITGLDPMGCFMYTNVLFTFASVEPLKSLDADFVDIIHTSAGKFGMSITMGHVDFWVNGGQTQTGCTFIKSMREFLRDQENVDIFKLACSHIRATEFYAESVIRQSTAPLPFESAMCGLFSSVFNDAECPAVRSDGMPSLSMGYHAKLPVCPYNLCKSSNFYVATNPASPLSMT